MPSIHLNLGNYFKLNLNTQMKIYSILSIFLSLNVLSIIELILTKFRILNRMIIRMKLPSLEIAQGHS